MSETIGETRKSNTADGHPQMLNITRDKYLHLYLAHFCWFVFDLDREKRGKVTPRMATRKC